jgi:hypothetical protein
MKRYSFRIAHWNSDAIFSPIRCKKDSIRLLMKTIKLMDVNEEIRREDCIGTIDLVVSKMSRLFYFSGQKYFSINFPFYVEERGERLLFRSRLMLALDSMVTSMILGLLDSPECFESNCILSFADPIFDLSDSLADIWPLFRELLMHEDGYIRYDYDPKNVNGTIHPLHHLDVFYSSDAAFKIGLHSGIGQDKLIDILRAETSCSFLSDHPNSLHS